MNNNNPNIVFHPLISSIQKVVLYETKTLLYLVGSNNRETRFRLLTIDRTKQDSLDIAEDPSEKNINEIRRFVSALGNPKVISAYGVLGFVRFLEGYYLILVTKRKSCAFIGMHLIYTIKDTVMVRVNESSPRLAPPNEQRYIKMFQSIDLRSNFYFSYSYDLTRTLQYNLSAPCFVGPGVDIEKDDPLPDWDTLTNNVENENERVDYAFRSNPRNRFVWNAFLLTHMQHIVLKDWLLEVVHGFVSQSCISIFGRHVNVCLLARRSTRFAGTRFLKRGANFKGDVANEVETEQIVTDGHRMCSFTQMRGSVPSHWSQDISKMVARPPISLDISDPFAQTPSRHFDRLLFHYGAPLIALNLVKKGERRKHESILAQEIKSSVKYLNQFLPPHFRIQDIHFDMARKSRGGGNVMEMLADISEKVVQQTGMFFKDRNEKSFQTGIVRVNCVDCLDRTNTAQFAIGKCALAHQLAKLGFIKPPRLEFDSDCVTMLENLYEDHGDTLALQYGGSQLVHRIKTYRKTAVWASQGNDIMQTLSRYYSNTFSDTEKQHSINLFLGYYIPSRTHSKQNQPIWELQSDYYMHNTYKPQSPRNETTLLTDWIRPKVRSCLPWPCSDKNKIVKELFRVHSKDLEMIDSYSNYHMSFKLTDFGEHIAFEICQMSNRYLPTFRINFSPFQRHEVRASRQNPSLTGQSSSTSNDSSSSSDEDNASSEDESFGGGENISNQIEDEEQRPMTFESLLPSMNIVYGCSISNPSRASTALYKKYVLIGKLSSPQLYPSVSSREQDAGNMMRSIDLKPLSDYGTDSYESVRPPTVSHASMKIYEEYCRIPRKFNAVPKFEDCAALYTYIKMI